MVKNIEIAKALEVNPVYISQIMNKHRPVSWPMAAKLAKMFSGDIAEWKAAGPGKIRGAFEKGRANG